MKKLKELMTNTRIIVLIVFVILSIVAINPHFSANGVAVRSIQKNSSIAETEMTSPEPGTPPMNREVITSINGQGIGDMKDYERIISGLVMNQSVSITTNEGSYRTTFNGDLGLNVYDAPTSNIKKGLDLQGGTRVLLQPEEDVGKEDMDLVIDNLKRRLNVYGLTDVVVREAGSLPPPLGQGQQYILVEVAGVNEQEVKNLLAKQGKFEAKIGNETVFRGGDDITYVCRSADCSGIDPQQGCREMNDGNHMCRFRYSITLSQDAAQRQAEVTEDLSVVSTDEEGNPLPSDNQYLNETLDLFLDGSSVDSLNVGKDLKGNAVTEIQISGSGVGSNRKNAQLNSLENMKQLQTVMITGSLPIELEIVKIDTISPSLGEEFSNNMLTIGILAILAVAGIIFVRYRSINVIGPILITMASEVILLLGLASLIGWNLDLAAVAGIIIAVGTGVDDQIVISDETLRKEKKNFMTWKQRIKRAFFIIMAAYFTTVVAMLPLWFAGAGLLKGFAVTTIFGVTFGVFITRPAFAAMVEKLEKDD